MSNWPLRMSLVTVLLSMTSSWMVTPRLVLHWSERNWFSVLLAVVLRVSSFIFPRSAALPESASSFLAAAGSKLWGLSDVSYPFMPLGMNVARDLPLPCSMSLTSLSRSIDLDSAMRTFLSVSGALVVLNEIQYWLRVGMSLASLLSLGSPRTTVTSARGTPMMSSAPVWYCENAVLPSAIS